MKTIKVKIKKYHLDITSEPETKEYKELTEKLNKADLQFFNVLSFQKGNDIPEGWHEIDTDFLFSNQYNTKSGFRIFEWYEIIHENKNIKEGYYISKGMDKLREAQKSQGICGYCGARYNLNEQPKQTWCDKCLDSEFLTENDLCLLRILPVYPEPRRITLVPDNIKELWKEKKKIGDKKRSEIKIAKRIESLKKEIEEKKYELEITKKFIERGVDIDNMIYYSHINRFCWGWKDKISKTEADQIAWKLKGINVNVEFKTI
jgi:hypothetical protein